MKDNMLGNTTKKYYPENRKKWIENEENYKKVLEVNYRWFKTEKGKISRKRSKVGLARLIRDDYAKEFRKLRSQSGLSQKEFSRLVKISKPSIQALEYGNTYLSDELLEQVLTKIGYAGEELLEKMTEMSRYKYPLSEVRMYLSERSGLEVDKLDNETATELLIDWKKENNK